MVIALFQFTTALTTEVVSLWLIATQNDVMDVIMNFVALAVISEIDNMFLDAVRDQYLKTYFDENPHDFEPVIVVDDAEVTIRERNCLNKLLYMFYILLDFFHKTFYFYFFPFLAIYLNFYVAGSVNCEFATDDGMICPTNPWGVN